MQSCTNLDLRICPSSSYVPKMQNDTVLIDQLEDQLIDHPDAKTRIQLNAETLDEAFQKKLNARAEQIANQNAIFHDAEDGTDEMESSNGRREPPVTIKNNLPYKNVEVETFETQVSEWFVSHDYEILQLKLLKRDKLTNQEVQKLIEELGNDIKDESAIGNVEIWRTLLYFALGEYHECTSVSQQTESMKKNLRSLHDLGISEFIAVFVKRLTGNNEVDDLTLFMVITIHYLLIITSLHSETKYTREMSTIMHKHGILSHLFSFVSQQAKSQHRTRNYLKIIKHLMLLQFGTQSHLASTMSFLNNLHGIEVDTDSKSLTCSPLQYFTIRENLMDKYPLYPLLQTGKSPKVENHYGFFMAANTFSNSLSNLLENPRPNRAHTAQTQLPAQTVHIATPTPTPPSVASEFMSGGEKIRKLYQINQGMPFIYPTDGLTAIPKAVDEAYNIFSSAVKEDLVSQQFWDERQRFMKQERGFAEESNNTTDDKYRYSPSLLEKYQENTEEINSLLRIEDFYEKNLADFYDFILLLVEIINVSKIDYPLTYAEFELNRAIAGEAHYDDILPEKLRLYIQKEAEIIAVKEITLKTISGIVDILLTWFKVSHILKCHHLTSVLYDQQYFEALFEFLNNCFDNNNIQIRKLEVDGPGVTWVYQNRLLNPQIEIPDFNFFTVCLERQVDNYQYLFINKVPLSDIPFDKTTNERTLETFNYNACAAIDHLLRIADEILIDNMSQRVFVLNELKPTDVLKAIVTNYQNDRIITSILNILKKLVPYQGRKWKASNMDIISIIYLKCDLSLKDDWLSGKDLESDFNTAYEQEIALRGLLQFFNMRHYPKQMEELGYDLSKVPRLDIEIDDTYV